MREIDVLILLSILGTFGLAGLGALVVSSSISLENEVRLDEWERI